MTDCKACEGSGITPTAHEAKEPMLRFFTLPTHGQDAELDNMAICTAIFDYMETGPRSRVIAYLRHRYCDD
jgi:hypothetical protein